MTGGIACPQGMAYWRLETDRRGQKVQEILGYRTQAIQSEEVGPRLGRRSPSNDSQRRMKYYNDSQRKNKEDSKINTSMSVCWFSYVLNRFQYKFQSQYTAMYKRRIFTLSISCCFRKKNFSSKDCTSGAGILATFVLFRIKVRTLQTKGLRTKQSETPHPSSVSKMHEMSSDSGYLWLHLPVGAQTSKMTL